MAREEIGDGRGDMVDQLVNHRNHAWRDAAGRYMEE